MRLNKVISTNLLAVFFLALTGCTNFEYHETENVPITQLSAEQEAEVVEEELLDVGIVLFNSGQVDLDTNDTDFSSVRDSEAVWFTQKIKQTLDDSNAWGLVRALPHDKLPLAVSYTHLTLPTKA